MRDELFTRVLSALQRRYWYFPLIFPLSCWGYAADTWVTTALARLTRTRVVGTRPFPFLEVLDLRHNSNRRVLNATFARRLWLFRLFPGCTEFATSLPLDCVPVS